MRWRPKLFDQRKQEVENWEKKTIPQALQGNVSAGSVLMPF
jgi:hypothetical protein